VKAEQSSHYWDSVSLAFAPNVWQGLWRNHSDQLNRTLLKNWLHNRRVANILKTDTFDEAVGEGLYPFLQEHAAVVHGIDIAPEFVSQAATHYPDFDVCQADVRDLSFTENSFDIVVSNSTLDHFQSANDIHRSLQELFRVMKAGGSLVISLDNLQNPIIGVRSLLPYKLLRKLNIVPYFVGATFGRRSLTAALEKAGFEVLETRAIMHCPRFLAVHLAGILQKRASQKTQQRFLNCLAWFEVLSKLPSRYFTGHFVAAHAVKPK
jgi:ubiquinone/menaquinone biosynthesis C-methylase UbiE